MGPHTAHFMWESVDTSEENIRGKFRGYKVSDVGWFGWFIGGSTISQLPYVDEEGGST